MLDAPDPPERALWAGHTFTKAALGEWTDLIVDAALGVPADDREAVVRVLCHGSDDLDRNVRERLADPWGSPARKHEAGLPPGTTIAGCVILHPLGDGATSRVYKAIQKSVRGLVALKVMEPASDAGADSFRREAARLRELHDRRIVTVHDVCIDEGRACILMELVDWTTLRGWMEQDEPDADRYETARGVMVEIALALQAAHRRGLVHRDLKPENVLVSKHEHKVEVKVLDFGIAAIADDPGVAPAGTVGYLAPEVLRGEPADARSDIFALGVMAYELIAGTLPYRSNDVDSAAAIDFQRAPRPFDGTVPLHLSSVVFRALAAARAERYGTVDELLADLSDAALPDDGLTGNVLLSEFHPRLRAWLSRPSAGLWLALGSFAWGVTSLVLAYLTRAACIRVLWRADQVPETVETVYGFAVEPNAGLWYAVGASATLIAGLWLIHAAHLCLAHNRSLRTRGAAVSGNELRREALRQVARYNARWFRVLTPVALLVGVGMVLGPELVGENRKAHAFGWVQADLPAVALHDTYEHLKATKKVDVMPAVAEMCPGCNPHIATLQNGPDGFEAPPPIGFRTFLGSALLHQGLFVAFLAWLALKVVFIFAILSLALLQDDHVWVSITPNLADRDDYRFGLGRLEAVYLALLAVLTLAFMVQDLQVAANWAKGTHSLRRAVDATLLGQLAGLGAVLLLLLTVFSLSFTTFVYLVIRNVSREKERLSAEANAFEQRGRAADSAAEQARWKNRAEETREQRRVAARQGLIPWSNPAFALLLVANLLLFVHIMQMTPAPGSPAPFGTGFWAGFGERVCLLAGNGSLK
jgi:hypothetical protein